MAGPRRPGGPRATKEDMKASVGTLGRVIKLMFSRYKFALIAVVVCIFTSVICNARGTLFMQSLIDDYIKPMVETGSTDFGPLLQAIGHVTIFYAIGIISTFTTNLI